MEMPPIGMAPVFEGPTPDSEVFKTSINFHGPLLLRKMLALRPKDWLEKNSMKANDFSYTEYKNRSKGLTGVKKAFDIAFEILNFTSTKSKSLFEKNNIDTAQTDETNDVPRLTLGHFMKSDKAVLKQLFHQTLLVGDLLVARILNTTNGFDYQVSILCYADNRIVNLEPLDIKGFLRVDANFRCLPNMYIVAVVVYNDANTRMVKLSLSADANTHHPESKLGRICWETSPHRISLQRLEETESFPEYLEKNKTFLNAYAIKERAIKYKIPLQWHATMMDTLVTTSIEENRLIRKPSPIEPLVSSSTKGPRKFDEANTEDSSDSDSSSASGSTAKDVDNFLQQERKLLEKSDKSNSTDTKKDDLSPLSQKMAMQANQWAPPAYINTTASHQFWQNMSVPPPNYFGGTSAVPPYGYQQFNNGRGGYAYHQQYSYPGAYNYPYGGPNNSREDPNLQGKMDAFLQHLNKRDKPRSHRSRSRSCSRSRRHHSDRRRYSRSRSRSRDRYGYRRSRRRSRSYSRSRSRDRHRSSSSRSRSKSRPRSRSKSTSKSKKASRSRSKSVAKPDVSRAKEDEKENGKNAVKTPETIAPILTETKQTEKSKKEKSRKKSDGEDSDRESKSSSSKRHKKHKKEKKSHKKKKDKDSSFDLDIPGLDDIEKKLNNYYKGLNSDSLLSSSLTKKSDAKSKSRHSSSKHSSSSSKYSSSSTSKHSSSSSKHSSSSSSSKNSSSKKMSINDVFERPSDTDAWPTKPKISMDALSFATKNMASNSSNGANIIKKTVNVITKKKEEELIKKIMAAMPKNST